MRLIEISLHYQLQLEKKKEKKERAESTLGLNFQIKKCK